MMKASDAKKLHFTDLFGRDDGLVGLMLVRDPHDDEPLDDEPERLVLVVQRSVEPDEQSGHWLWPDARVLVRKVTPDMLEQWVAGGVRHAVRWLMNGDVLIDREGYLDRLRRRIGDGDPQLRERRLLCEYSGFARSYSLAKRHLKEGQTLDAFSYIMAALQHWSHIVLLEQGAHPELAVWEQVRRVNPGIYKLYEELTTSPEPLGKRVELLVLACEFSVLTQMQSCCEPLLRILRSRDEPWSAGELMGHPDLQGLPLPLDVPMLLRKLAKRGCVREVAGGSARRRGPNKLELRYIADGD